MGNDIEIGKLSLNFIVMDTRRESSVSAFEFWEICNKCYIKEIKKQSKFVICLRFHLFQPFVFLQFLVLARNDPKLWCAKKNMNTKSIYAFAKMFAVLN